MIVQCHPQKDAINDNIHEIKTIYLGSILCQTAYLHILDVDMVPIVKGQDLSLLETWSCVGYIFILFYKLIWILILQDLRYWAQKL